MEEMDEKGVEEDTEGMSKCESGQKRGIVGVKKVLKIRNLFFYRYGKNTV